MKPPNIYQMHKHSSHLKKQALSMACAKQAIEELVDLGFTVTGFSLGLRATVTVQPPSRGNVLRQAQDERGLQDAHLHFVPVSIGFDGRMHYTTYGSVFGRFAVEWRQRRYPGGTIGGVRSVALRACRRTWY